MSAFRQDSDFPGKCERRAAASAGVSFEDEARKSFSYGWLDSLASARSDLSEQVSSRRWRARRRHSTSSVTSGANYSSSQSLSASAAGGSPLPYSDSAIAGACPLKLKQERRGSCCVPCRDCRQRPVVLNERQQR